MHGGTKTGAAAGMQKEQGTSTWSVQDVCWATSACRSPYCTTVDRYMIVCALC